MGYSDYLKNLLRPMRLYELDEGCGAAEIEVLGGAFDEVFEALERAEAEAIVPTAEDKGLSAFETILPYTPGYLSLAGRRGAIMALLRIDGCSFTPSALCDTLSGCGVSAVVQEAEAANTVRVSFPGTRGLPQGFEGLKVRVEKILPCHLDIEYFIVYITWAEIETWFSSWTEMESACADWNALEKYAQ